MIRFLFVALFTSFSWLAFAQITVVDTMLIGGLRRAFRYYVPASYQQGTPAPLVFNFHGLGSNALNQENYGDFRPIADTAGFIIVHPQGLSLNGTTGWFSFFDVAQIQGDLSFITAIMDTLTRRFTLDPDRFYSTGMSNGGFMTYDVACFMNQRFAAVASVTGTMVPDHLSACQPGRAVPVLHFHGTNDATVPYSGVGGALPFVPVDSLMQFWIRNNACNPMPATIALPNVNVNDNSTVNRYTWTQGRGGSEVVLYKILGGGHTWPGSAFSSPTATTNQDINASRITWEFFRKFTRNAVVSVKEELLSPAIAFWPNPGHGLFQVNWEGESPVRLEFWNAQGKKCGSVELKPGRNELNLESFPAGFYSYSTNHPAGLSGKLVKY